MPGLVFPYDRAVSLDSVPVISADELGAEILRLIAAGGRLLAFFGLPLKAGSDRAGLCAILACPDAAKLCAMRTEPLAGFESLALRCPQTQLFEREIYEDWHITPENHPWLKPVRIAPDAREGFGNGDAGYGFYRVQGAMAHEVAVGPVHAGIIEPGHFRFQCYGENVLNLEIALGYQHRGIEKMLLAMPCRQETSERRLRLVECVAGDASVAHATAQCVLWERLLGGDAARISPQEQRLRRIGLELERLACHCGDIGAIAGDTGYLPTSAWNGRIRGDFLNLTARICGNRFGREFLRLGGTAWDLAAEECAQIAGSLKEAGRDAIGSSGVMFASSSVRDRLAGTGALSLEDAAALGLVGVAARACGLALDARFQTPLSDLPLGGTAPRLGSGGDVMARARVRFLELADSLALVAEDLQWLSSHQAKKTPRSIQARSLPPNMLAVAQVESWRGEVCHVAVTGGEGKFLACKIIDPSFHNWAGLALAMRGGQVSDFPLCNKSFNLSYCGHDL